MDYLLAGMSYAWMFSVAVIGLVELFVYRNVGPRRAVGAGVLLSLLVPEWVRWEITPDAWINVTVAVSALGLLMYLFHPQSTYNFRLNWCDYAALSMVGAHILSDCFSSGPHPLILIRAYGEWVLPYLAGRVAIQEVGDARWLLPWAVGVTLTLTLFAAYETFCVGLNHPKNFFEELVGNRPTDDHAPWYQQRFGFKRAYGPTHHPIYFGVLMFLLYPWMVYADARAAKNKAPRWWRAMPYVCAFGVFTALSRAPLLALPIVFFLMQIILKPAWRPVWIGVAVVSAIVLFLTWDKVYYVLESVSRESESKKKVVIEGEKVRFTGTLHRLLMFDVYGEALGRAGPFGYGTEKCSVFPPLVPGRDKIPVEMHSVDDAFLLYALRFGFVGFLCFTALGIAGQWGYLQLALKPHAEGGVWLAAMASTLAAMAFVLFTVWMPQDFGFFYLFCIGAAGGLWAEREAPLIDHMEAISIERIERSQRRRRRRSSSSEEADEPASESVVEEFSTPEETNEESSRSSRRRSRRSRSNE